MNARVTRFRAGESGDGQTIQTEGMRREQLVAGDNVWVGMVYSEPGMSSGWHHHGDHDTYVYCVAGSVSIEFGPNGTESIDGEPGDVIHVPKGVVHRESTTGANEGAVFLVRVGEGVPVVNVDGPES